MRILDIRRHTMRRKPGQHLSRDGIALARWVGDESLPYDLVVTSTIPRAIETAIAMGFEVDQLAEGLGRIPDGVHNEISFPSAFLATARAVARKGPTSQFAEEQARLWQDVVQQVPDGGRALIITHGLFIECGVIACLPDEDHASWGDPIAYCEGMRLHHNGRWQSGKVLRVPQDRRFIEN